MIFFKERVTVICEQLKKVSVSQKIPLTQWRMKKGDFLYPRDADASPEDWVRFDSLSMHWYGPDKHYWFRSEFTVPQSFDEKPLYMLIKTQIDEYDDGKNPQFLLFVNGEITQGLDMNHREVLLTLRAKAGQRYVFDLQAYTGTLHSEFLLICEMAEISASVNGLYYDLQVPLWGTQRMEEGDKARMEILSTLNDTVNLLDMRKPHSAEFYASVNKAREHIQRKLYEKMAGYSDIVATCIGHTHIDVAWWWTVAQTREKVARSFATVLKLMEEYPNYKFMSSQPQLYSFIKERYPELYEKIKDRIRDGRWEPEGGMWLEADCNLTSGESLVRQFLYGKRFFKEEFGADNRILWLPDVFGYSAALPQIMKKCGIDYFMTTKLSWNQFNKIPCDTFYWQGIDGSEVLTHFISTLDVGQKSGERFFTTYNGKLHPDAIMGAWERYQNKNLNNDILIAFGYGDGGGGPTRDMLETSSRMEKGVKGIPKVRQEFSLKYFEELEQQVKTNRHLPKWTGELYFEYHRGTYTSMARNKRSNRKSELMMMDLELLSVMAMDSGLDYPANALDSMWKTILLNQFHDILPGTSINEVYEVTQREYDEIHKTATSLIRHRLSALAGHGNAVTIFNTLGFENSTVVNIGAVDESICALSDGEGKVYPVQHTADGTLVYVTALPSKGYASYSLVTGDAAAAAFTVTENGIETPFYSVTFDKSGFMASVFDKENGREVLQKNTRANLMRVYEDKPIYYDNWDIDIYYTEKYWDVDNLISMVWIENGPVRAGLRLARQFSDSIITQNIYFYTELRRIDFETHVDWHEHQHLLKVSFPVEIHADEAAFDVQFGNVTRKIHKNTSWDIARFESCAHKWADISEGNYGVSLLNDCKYGHSIQEGKLELTLIKSGIEPNPVTDQEEHFFTYSLFPHKDTWQKANTAKEASKLNQPTYAAQSSAFGGCVSFASVDSEYVMLETVKLAENKDGIILRLYEYMNCRGTANVTLSKPILSVVECDLMENPLKTDAIKLSGSSFAFSIKPYEIKTFKVII